MFQDFFGKPTLYAVIRNFIKLSLALFKFLELPFLQVFRLISLWFGLSFRPIVVDSMLGTISEVFFDHCYMLTSEALQGCIFQNNLFCICVFYISSRLQIIQDTIYHLLSGSILQVYSTSLPNCFKDGKHKRKSGSSKLPGITWDSVLVPFALSLWFAFICWLSRYFFFHKKEVSRWLNMNFVRYAVCFGFSHQKNGHWPSISYDISGN